MALHPDLVLLDLGLPKMDGYQVARRIGTMPQLKDVKVVALTGYGRDEDLQKSQEAGCMQPASDQAR